MSFIFKILRQVIHSFVLYTFLYRTYNVSRSGV